MTHQDNPAVFKAAATYDAAADCFDAAPLGFWKRHGRRAVELLSLEPGERVFDAGCGTGASAIPAAQAVGAAGEVIGYDVAENMLLRAREKAAALKLDNTVFECRDMAGSDLPAGSFDAVIAVFAIFFVEDMEQLLALWQRLIRPGGRLVITTWGPQAFQPAAEIYTQEVLRARPDRAAPPRPWERLVEQNALQRLFTNAGAAAPHIELVDDIQPLQNPDDWWTIALGSGYRGEIEQLNTEERAQIRAATLQRLSEMGVKGIETNAIHAIAHKPTE